MTGEEVIKCFVEEESKKESETAGEMRVDTPFGAIVARVSKDQENPGIWIDLCRPDADLDLQLALVEFSTDEGDLPEGKGHIITRVWGDSEQKDYTDRVVHRGIENHIQAKNAEAIII